MERTREAHATVSLYLQAKPHETEEQVQERLEQFIYFLQDVHPDLSSHIYDMEFQEF